MMHLVLTTDDSWTEDGFKIYYEVFDVMQAPCSDLGVPDNGYRSGDNFSAGSVLTFACDDGFTLIGEEKLTCVPGQGWGGSSPTCEAVCGGNITERTSGLIYSPNYPWRYDNNLHCAWTIEVALGMGVLMTPEFMSIDDSDKMIFYDGGREDTDILIGEFNGGGVPDEVMSTSNVIHVVFTSDESIRQWGFRINYEVACGGYLTGISSGVIFSPGYPGQYPSNLNCTWTIEVDSGEGIKISPAEFSLEEVYDKFIIFDGDTKSNATLVGEYSGQNIPEEIMSTSNIIQLVLTTDDSYAEDGFKLFYDAFPLNSDPCPDPGVPKNGYRVGDSFSWDSLVSFGCNDGYLLIGQARIRCQAESRWSHPFPSCVETTCSSSRVLYEEEGEIRSPIDTRTYDYPHNVDCR
ncbi:CSMD3 [Branchiostoma lanceolatum]|uniref:CSMD3 protein n=1 Tax=Branchiostoma lanceolatum TaxID=7740 RepID=A0A8J9YSD1_BRALA|nr:CSMD3 [Branchiostoma lanceolatum]